MLNPVDGIRQVIRLLGNELVGCRNVTQVMSHR